MLTSALFLWVVKHGRNAVWFCVDAGHMGRKMERGWAGGTGRGPHLRNGSLALLL